jgi:glycosyltransferase involved in cell wall biosynthesis
LNASAVIVHHNTPYLLKAAVWSLRSMYPSLEILVVDSGSSQDVAAEARSIVHAAHGKVIHRNENVHHGPGMDIGLRDVASRYVLLFDSDCIAFRNGFIEGMMSQLDRGDAYMCGEMMTVDGSGFNAEEGQPYIHPKCALVDRERYLTLPPFEKHGAPCLTNQRAASEAGMRLIDFPVDDHIFHLGRGTVSGHGYGLGWKSRLAKVGRKLRGS